MPIIGKIVPFFAGVAVATLAYTNTYDSLWHRVDKSIFALRNIQKQIPDSTIYQFRLIQIWKPILKKVLIH